MTTANSSNQTDSINKKVVLSVILFAIIAIVGLTYVKWLPYYHKAFDAAAKHSIGSSIVSGQQPAAPAPSWQAAWDYALAYYKSVWKAALLGILLGSLVQVLLPSKWLLRVLGQTTFKSTVIGGISSIPGMMCTCCAAPLAVGLRRKNVSVGASLAFWLGNPTINPATLVFMTFVLSWKFTLIRLLFGLVLTFGVSYLANFFAGKAEVPESLAVQPEELKDEPSGSFVQRWLKSIGSMVLHIVPSYIIAVLVLGASRAWLFPAVQESSGNHILLIIGLAIAGTLFVIPTAAEIPIIQTLMSFGLGTGPAAALLLTLPAVSLPSLLMISRSFPKKVILMVTVSVIGLGILSGIAGAIFL
ncbi:permease [Paenibacillus sp. GCM10023248]|uniref:permease n=1 Tax=unclassified Paenibacillus TaxID=185978 RepID=UPI00237808D7|nr:permease [Paenibacillus sp. MAHUQ-63]MDD9270905.1 permease [Paenibacillus sp. MAHUQ-63]